VLRGDQAKVSALVRVPLNEAFRIFTEEIDGWWRSGMKYRLGKNRSVVHLEPKLGGRLFESFLGPSGAENIRETGVITLWDPPNRMVFDWRAANFSADEKTEVEVAFEPTASGTYVTVIHRGWAQIRNDHPARHGEELSAFTRSLGAWWGDLMTSLRMRAEGTE
jgi:uncharacterized protein YndB with AHSA1/START domain